MFFQPYHFDAYNPHTGTFSYGFLRKLFTGQYRSYGKHSYHIRVDNISWPTTANSHCVCSHYVWPLQPLCLASSPDKPKRLQGFFFIKFFSKVATELNFLIKLLKKNFLLDGKTRQAKLSLPPLNLPAAPPLMKSPTAQVTKSCEVDYYIPTR